MTDIYQLLSDYYDLMEAETKDMFRGLWDGYRITIQNLYMKLWLRATVNFIQSMFPYYVKTWIPITSYSDTKPYTVLDDVISIPTLQDKYYSPTTTFAEGTDYDIVNGAVKFNDSANDGKTLWAEYVYLKNPYFSYWGYEDYDCYGSDIAEVAKLVEYAIKYGANKKVMGYALNGLAGYPFAFTGGSVKSVTDAGDHYVVVIGDGNREHVVAKDLVGSGTVIGVGDDVERFQPLISGKVTITETYGYTYSTEVHAGQYKTLTTIVLDDGTAVNAGDYLAIIDIWAGTTEYGVVDSFDAGTNTITLSDNMYLKHDADTRLLLRKINPVSGPTTIDIAIVSHVGLSDKMKANIDKYYKSVQNPAIKWNDIIYN